jgi:hypothetical protein
MKSVLRSAFDPVPRPLSVSAQLLVVGLLVVGITISVVEYLESSKLGAPPADSAQLSTTPEASAPALRPEPRPRNLVRAAPVRAVPGSSASVSDSGSSTQPSTERSTPMSFQPGEDG